MTKARTRRKPAPVFEPLDGPTPEQFANGDYRREDIIHADLHQRATVHINRGGTPVMRWWNAGKLDRRQMAAIEWCQRLWHIAGTSQKLTAEYGERIPGNVSTELRAVKLLAASEDLHRFKSYVSRSSWQVFENVCRFGWSAGVAGAELGYGTRSAETRAHTLVCVVADMIAEKERL